MTSRGERDFRGFLARFAAGCDVCRSLACATYSGASPAPASAGPVDDVGSRHASTPIRPPGTFPHAREKGSHPARGISPLFLHLHLTRSFKERRFGRGCRWRGRAPSCIHPTSRQRCAGRWPQTCLARPRHRHVRRKQAGSLRTSGSVVAGPVRSRPIRLIRPIRPIAGTLRPPPQERRAGTCPQSGDGNRVLFNWTQFHDVHVACVSLTHGSNVPSSKSSRRHHCDPH